MPILFFMLLPIQLALQSMLTTKSKKPHSSEQENLELTNDLKYFNNSSSPKALKTKNSSLQKTNNDYFKQIKDLKADNNKIYSYKIDISRLENQVEILNKELESLKPKEISKEDKENMKRYGDNFEKKVGKHYEKKGYKVEYRGLELGLKDGGIDLVAINKNELLLIQCKYWKKENSITPNMIKEFYGNCHFFIDKDKTDKYRYKTITCIYAITDHKSLHFGANQIFKENYIKCRYEIFK